MTQLMTPRVAAAVATAIGSIPGCAMDVKRVLDLRMRPKGWGTQVHLSGWSPSLHEIDMCWEVVIGPYDDEERQTASALASIAGLLEAQRERAAEGLLLACRPSAFPLRISGNRFGAVHLDADASALAVHIGDDDARYTRSPPHTPEQAARHRKTVLETPAVDRMGALDQFIADIHRSCRDHGGGSSLRGQDVSVSERRGRRVLDWTQLIRTKGAGSVSGTGMIRGTTLNIGPVSLPASVESALVGRPLHTLVDIHPMVSPRIIRRVRTLNDGSLSVTLAPAQVSIEEVRTMTVAQALDHLGRIISGGDCRTDS